MSKFDDTILHKIDPVLSSLSGYIQKNIKKIFDNILNCNSDEMTDKTNYFLNCLYETATDDAKKNKKNKLAAETVDKIKKILIV